MAARDTFHRHLRHALNHIYEPDMLRASPLVNLLLTPEQAHLPLALSRLLTDAIESLKPAAGTPANALAWRNYELLLYRYVHCATQKDLAEQLMVSVRQLRREQSRAVEVLADVLLRQFNLTDADIAALDDQQAVQPAHPQETGALLRELQWLQSSALGQGTDLRQDLQAVQLTVGPLSEQYNVQFDIAVDDAVSDVAVPSVVLRQALLSLLTMVIPQALNSTVSLHVQRRDWKLDLRLYARNKQGSDGAMGKDTADKLGDAKALLRFCGGSLHSAQEANGLVIRVGLPLENAVPVLAIDDNRDALQLLERYLAGTRYRLVACHEPEQALSLVEAEQPALIILDVMMVGMDGWELLRSLRERPTTASCPIIICTVLAQEEMALSLGAQAFLRKPVSRQALLKVLDREHATSVKAPR